MDIFTIVLWVITVTWFIWSIIKDKKRTLNSIKMSKGLMGNMIGEIIGILFLIGLILTFIPPDTIKQYMGTFQYFYIHNYFSFCRKYNFNTCFCCFSTGGFSCKGWS